MFYNITVFYCIFNQINAALVSNVFQNIFLNPWTVV